jgi:hypothetical protein
MGIVLDLGDGGERPDADEPDGSASDGGRPDGSGFPVACRLEHPSIKLVSDVVDRNDRRADVVATPTGFAVAWTDARTAVAETYVYFLRLGAEAGTEHRLTEDAFLSRDAALGRLGEGLAALWIDNSTGTFELWARRLDATGTPETAVQRLTNNALREDGPRLAVLDDGTLLAAWIESDGLGGMPSVRLAVVGPTGALSGGTRAVPGITAAPASLALSPLGSGAALAWVEEGAVRLQVLGPTGAPTGAARTINVEGNASGAVGLATRGAGGAVIFGARIGGARDEVRVRMVDAAGAADGSERIVTPPPERGVDPGVAQYATGYAVAYRALPEEGRATTVVRLVLLDGLGNRVVATDLADTSAEGGPVQVAVAGDGRVAVTWATRMAEATTVNLGVVVCE